MKSFRKPVRVLLGLTICGIAALTTALTVRPAHAGSGEPDVNNLFANVGAIVVTDPALDPFAPEVVGSGVLIHPRVLLTAGHVTASGERALANGIPIFDMSAISFGTNAYDPSTWLPGGVALMTHPDFDPSDATPDVGVVILKDAVDIPCATVARTGFLDDLKEAGLLRYPGVAKKFVAVGYGRTISFPPPEEHFADGLRRFDFPAFRGLEGKEFVVLNQNQAAGNTGIGAGDSGGPLFWIGPRGELTVVAVNRLTDARRVAHMEEYRVDTTTVRSFLSRVIQMVEAGDFD